MTAAFSGRAWNHVADTYAAILEHPFVVQLGSGELGPEVFVRYLLDDAHYLVDYARALALVAARMPTADLVGLLAQAASDAVQAERSLHRGFLGPLGVDPESGDPSAACRAYTGFLCHQAAVAPVEVALAAVVPCFRVYAEVGRHLLSRRRSGEHPYAEWIETYADPGFDAAVRAIEAAADALAEDSPHVDAMLRAYALATDHEWRFWDAAWQGPGRADEVVRLRR